MIFQNCLKFHSPITYSNFEISLVVFMPNITTNHAITYTYYINTNEIPGEFSSFHLWKDHLCYDYIINRAFHSKKLFKWNGLAFIGFYIINSTLHGCLEIWNFSSRVEKNFMSERSKQVKYFATREEKFCISARPCNILYVSTFTVQIWAFRLEIPTLIPFKNY